MHGAQTAPAARPPAPRRAGLGRRAVRYGAWFALGLFVVLALALGGLWFWSASDESLNTLLRLVQRHMPAGSSLHTEGVSGSLRRGGRIGKLVYRLEEAAPAPDTPATQAMRATRPASAASAAAAASATASNAAAAPAGDSAPPAHAHAQQRGALVVTLEDVSITWNWAALRHRATQLRHLHARLLTIEDTRAAQPRSKPPQPLKDLLLPVGVDAPFTIDTLAIARPPNPTQTIHGLQGRYRYDHGRAQHQLAIDALRYQQGSYTLQATLGGQAPMPLQLTAGAQLELPTQTEEQTETHAETPAETAAKAAAASPSTSIASSASAAHAPVKAAAPAITKHLFQIDLHAQGTLAGADATLQINAKAQPARQTTAAAAASSAPDPSPASAPTPATSPAANAAPAALLELEATLHPWQQHMLSKAQAQWQHLNLQAFAPRAPHTLLQGKLQLQAVAAPAQTGATHLADTHAGDTAQDAQNTQNAHNTQDALVQALAFLGNAPPWQATLHASNAEAGPINQQRLPLHTLTSELRYHNGHLQLQAFDWQLAPSGKPGGRITGQGQYRAAQGWQGQWQLQQLNPAALHSAAQAAPLQGTIEVLSDLLRPGAAQALPPQKADRKAAPAPQAGQPAALSSAPIVFKAALQSVGGRNDAALLHFDEIAVQGRWHEQVANLSRIVLRSRGGTLQGQARYDVARQSAQTDMTLQAPGSSGSLKGQLAPDSGQGQLRLDVRNLRQTSQWLRPWPGMAFLRTRALQGSAQLQASWRGGWRNNGQNMQLHAHAQAPAITISQPGHAAVAPMLLRDARLTLQGSLANAQLQAAGHMQQGNRSLQLALQGSGGKRNNGWQAQLQALQAQLRDTIQKQQWQAELASPVPITVAQSKDRLQVQTGAFQIRLRGNTASTQEAHIQGEPLRFVQHGSSYQISSKGNIRGLPLAWLQTLSGSATLDQSLTGDMLFDGAWNVELGQRLQLQAHLARSSGDIVILSGSGGQGRVAAGTRAARIDMHSTGSNVEARLLWDSAQAGTANAHVRTQLQRTASGWSLPGSAPVSGQLQARLPRVGIWNLFAPPGWRLRGTLDANIALGGTLHTPLLHGTLNMDDLGVRSIVDGIAFSNGRLRARLNGQRMDVDEFSLQGSPSRTGLLGTQRIGGGSLNITGYTQWGGGASLLDSVRMQLSGKLNQLQLFTLPDRLIVLSGDINAGFAGMQLTLRGGLRVNRALIELPESSAPKLGDDVFILPSARHPKAALAQTAQPAAQQAPSPIAPAAPSAPAAHAAHGATTAQPTPKATSAATPALGGDVVVLARPAPPASAAASAAQPSAAPTRSRHAPRQGTARAATASAATSRAAAVASTPAPGHAARADSGSAATLQPKPGIAADIQIGIDLGNDFRVRGRGLDTRINGQLTVKGGPTIGDLPRITGTVNTDRGTFRAYGQDLQIERGHIVFNGAAANPTLDIVALRSNLDIRVGVRINGTVQRPIVQLFSEPPMPDSERLSWLVLGRSSYSAADAALLQQAAMALLGGDGRGITGQLADALGLDDVNFKGGDSISTSSVTLGKRFSKNFYVSYEKGLDATVGTLYFFLDLSRKLKLRAQTGQQSALELIYTVSYD